jgi:hypothetical protein
MAGPVGGHSADSVLLHRINLVENDPDLCRPSSARKPGPAIICEHSARNRTGLLTEAFAATCDVIFAAHIIDFAMRDVRWTDIFDRTHHRQLAMLRFCDCTDAFCAAHERVLEVIHLRPAIPLYCESLGHELRDRLVFKHASKSEVIFPERSSVQRLKQQRKAMKG